jgi:hypothetical protein
MGLGGSSSIPVRHSTKAKPPATTTGGPDLSASIIKIAFEKMVCTPPGFNTACGWTLHGKSTNPDRVAVHDFGAQRWCQLYR